MNGTTDDVLSEYNLMSDRMITGWALIRAGEFSVTYTFLQVTFGYIIINSTELSPTPCHRGCRICVVFNDVQ